MGEPVVQQLHGGELLATLVSLARCDRLLIAVSDGRCATRSGHSVLTKGWLVQTRETMTHLSADPEHCPRISRRLRPGGRTPPTGSREHARSFPRDEGTYRWQQSESGRIVSRTKAEMGEKHGLRPDSLDSLVAGRVQTSRGWRLAPRPLLGESPRWIFP